MRSSPGYVESAEDCAIAARNAQHGISYHYHYVVSAWINDKDTASTPAYYACTLDAPLTPVKAQASDAEAQLFAPYRPVQRLAGTAALIAALACNRDFSLPGNYSHADPRNSVYSRYFRSGSRTFAAHLSIAHLADVVTDDQVLPLSVSRAYCEGTILAGGEVFDFDPSNTTLRYHLGSDLEVVTSSATNILTDDRWPNRTSNLVEALGTENTLDIYNTARAMFDLCARSMRD